MEPFAEDQEPITPLAITNYREAARVFGIKKKNRRGHLYLIGKTGTGKSTLLHNLMLANLRMGHGFALLDPHGDLAESVLDFIPARRVKETIYFNPADAEHPMAFNPLEKVPLETHSLVVSGLISIFKKVWAEFWGPRLEHILRNALYALLEYPQSTFLDLPRLLTESEFRRRVLAHLTHPQVKAFWLYEFEKYSNSFRSEATAPILNKIGQLLTTPLLRNIVGQHTSAFNLRQAMDDGQLLIVNLAKGKIGEDNCSLLGAMLVTKIQLAAMSRADVSERERRPFYLYVDEFHDFLTLSFANILSEARKYGLNLVLAHQYLEQLDEKLRAAIFGNVGTMIAFRVGAEDARPLAREFAPAVRETDLTTLPNHQVYLKLMIDGSPSRPFSARTLPPPARPISSKREVITFCRKQYGKPKAVVEKELGLPRPPLKRLGF